MLKRRKKTKTKTKQKPKKPFGLWTRACQYAWTHTVCMLQVCAEVRIRARRARANLTKARDLKWKYKGEALVAFSSTTSRHWCQQVKLCSFKRGECRRYLMMCVAAESYSHKSHLASFKTSRTQTLNCNCEWIPGGERNCFYKSLYISNATNTIFHEREPKHSWTKISMGPMIIYMRNMNHLYQKISIVFSEYEDMTTISSHNLVCMEPLNPKQPIGWTEKPSPTPIGRPSPDPAASQR